MSRQQITVVGLSVALNAHPRWAGLGFAGAPGRGLPRGDLRLRWHRRTLCPARPVFPTALRVTDTGLAIGIGRGGAVLGPLIGGFLIAAGTSIALAIAIVGTGARVAAVLLLALQRAQTVPS